MRNIVSHVRFRAFFPLLVMAVLFTLPSTVTGSKYVWEDTIDVSLWVSYPGTIITSLQPDGGYPSEFWVWDLTNIQATATADGLILTAESGYTLPEAFTVWIGSAAYTVWTNGQNAFPDLSFDPATGLLTVSEVLLGQRVTVEAVAVPAEDPLTSAPTVDPLTPTVSSSQEPSQAADPLTGTDAPTDPLADGLAVTE